MTKPTEILGTIIQAPNAFKSRNTLPSGLEGTIDAFYNGMLFVKTKMGEVVLKLLENHHMQSGTKIFLHRDKTKEHVRISTVQKSNTQPSNSATLKSEPRIRPSAASFYRVPPEHTDAIKGHHTAAEATLESAISSASKNNAFDVARSMCLLPNMDRDRGVIAIMTFLLVSLTRGKLKSWSAMAPSNNSSWDHVMMERLIDGPDTKKWKTRQFPINLSDETVWAIFATPDETSGPVSRFIVEIPTQSFGLVQIKAFGQGSTSEVVITSHTSLSDNLQDLCRAAILNVADEIDADIDVSFVGDPKMLANLTQARRTSFEA